LDRDAAPPSDILDGSSPGRCVAARLGDNDAMGDRMRALGQTAWSALQSMVREILRRKPGGHLIESRLPEIDLRLPLVLEGRSTSPEIFTSELAAAIEQQIDDAIEEAGAFQPGHAFCHRCEAAACEHSRPPTSRHVFLGYAPTGAPRWMEFGQYALEARHPDFDRLWEANPAFITVLMDRADLHGAMLGSFRNDDRVVFGQVVAGFFTLPPRPGEGRAVLALTLQAVASRAAGGRRRLGLNILGAAPGGEDLAMLWERQGDLPWRRAVRWAQAALVTVAREARNRRRPRPSRGNTARDAAGVEGGAGSAAAGGDQGGWWGAEETLERRVMGILQGLARRLEQDVRGRGRRTAHAGERHEGGERPTRKAIDDIRGAGPEAFLRDERAGTVVVLGDRGRTHFLTPEGRLVSSVRYSREAIDKKRGLGLWQPLGRTEAEAAREAALKVGGDGGATD
jgi:hypothetical protein